MLSKPVHKPDQIRLIKECRESGLSDYQWCKQNNIKPGTFYNWISKLRKLGYRKSAFSSYINNGRIGGK